MAESFGNASGSGVYGKGRQPRRRGGAWYVANALLEGRGKAARLVAPVLAAAAAALIVAGCGGGQDQNQFRNEQKGDYEVEVTRATFPASQVVARTYEMRIDVENTGDEPVPAINIAIALPGRDSTLAFAYRSPQPGLAASQRPAWVLEEGYPKLAGTVGRGGAQTSSKRTFQFGTLAPGQTARTVWRVTAIQPGDFDLSWRIGAGLGLGVNAVDRSGETPAGLFEVSINNRPRLTEIDDQGRIVPISPDEQRRLEIEEESSE